MRPVVKRNPRVEALMPKWKNGYILGPDGTNWTIQREQTNGAQSGGLIYYAWKWTVGARQWTGHDDDTATRTRATAVQTWIENHIRKQIAASLK